MVSGERGPLHNEKKVKAYLEITADKSFSDELKMQIWPGREIIFNFLKLRHARPDITGFIESNHHTKDFIAVEVKGLPITLDSIYQTKKYSDLFDAQFSFLISWNPIPEEIKRLDKIVHPVLHLNHWRKLFILARFNTETGKFTEWYPRNPFLDDQVWQDYQEQKIVA